MPTDGDRPDDNKSTDEEVLDPLSQPPLVRPPPRPLTGNSLQKPADPEESDSEQPAAEAASPERGSGAHAGGADAGAEDAETPDADSSDKADASPPPPPKPRGRFLGFLGLLFGLAGMAVAGYLYYFLIYLAPEAQVDARIAVLESDIASGERALDELARSQDRALSEFAAEQQRTRDASMEEVLEAVNRAVTLAPPSRREWKVAELAYLLRIANHRVLMEQDVSGALALLKAADAILVELDDFALYQVRARLAEEILSLQNVESNDVQGLFLRLEAVKTEVSLQSVKLPRFSEGAASQVTETAGFWTALWTQLGSYFRFRRFDGESVRPLLAPEEEVYLELNLRLMLERAQLAALRREQVIYEQSLQTAADWMASYLDSENQGVQRSLEELDTLSDVQLEQTLPDISGSLTTLQSLGEA